MATLNTPLNDQELDKLDAFLLDRIPEEAEEAITAEDNEGILNISELDGFLTAIISGPVALQPSDWLPVVWGDFEPQWESIEESEAMVSLLLRHMNDIVTTLMDNPEAFNPIVLERETEDGIVTIVDEWCFGYMKGVGITRDAWQRGGDELMEMMFPILLFSSEKTRERLKDIDAEEEAILKRSIGGTARKLHAFWLERRSSSGNQQPFTHSGPQVGRNDPCICGSGKKFKKCCLH